MLLHWGLAGGQLTIGVQRTIGGQLPGGRYWGVLLTGGGQLPRREVKEVSLQKGPGKDLFVMNFDAFGPDQIAKDDGHHGRPQGDRSKKNRAPDTVTVK